MDNHGKATIMLPQAISLYMGAVLGSGILIVPGLAAQIAGPASLLDWGSMMILVMPLSMCMAYLSQKYPNTGGVSYFVTKGFGEKAGNLIGWFFLMSIPIGAPVAAITGAGYLSKSLGLSKNYMILFACLILLFAILLNFVGMGFAGKVQVAVVSGILCILITTIIGSIPSINVSNFTPFFSHDVGSLSSASTILFWCFIGWEAVSHLTEEFVHPDKDVMKATIISAVLIGIIYFFTAFAVVGTNSYIGQSQVALVSLANHAFGPAGAVAIGAASFLICQATVISYIGAGSRLAFSLAKNGHAPNWFGYVSNRWKTPAGGLAFLAVSFSIVMILYTLHAATLTELIELPNVTFLLTYFAGCASGMILFKKDKKKFTISLISFIATAFMLLFVGKSIIYPIAISLLVTVPKTIQMTKNYFTERKKESNLH